MDRKGHSAIIFFVVISLLIGLFFYIDKKTLNENNSSALDSAINFFCIPLKGGSYSIDSQNLNTLFKDYYYGIELDLSSTPDAKVSQAPFCPGSIYTLTLYPQEDKIPNSSNKSLVTIEPTIIQENIDLKQIAMEKYGYREGFVSSRGYYSAAVNMSKIKEGSLANGLKFITWEQIFSDGSKSQKHYLVTDNKQFVHIVLESFSKQDFDESSKAFTNIVGSLNLNNSLKSQRKNILQF